MEIRAATLSDIPEIVDVLRSSLGEADLPLTEDIWKFKHIKNPFGESLVFVAEEKGNIIGVRAFMKWRWQLKNKIFNAVRAVDTATHPQHQKKGIFKNLTLEAVNIAIKNGDNFVFNTPNDKSRPGYLKMGWEEVGKVRVRIIPHISFKPSEKNHYQIQKSCSEKELEQLCVNWNTSLLAKGKLFTPKSSKFLKWRYEENSLQKYEIVSTPDFYLAAYIKPRPKNIRELRIAECIFQGKENFREIKMTIKRLAKRHNAHFLSLAPDSCDYLFSLQGDFGPVITLRDLNLKHNERESLLNLNNWNYSLGDLELF